MIKTSFQTISQRVIFSYLCSFPDFKPTDSSIADKHSQRQMYTFVNDLIQRLYADPYLLKLPMDLDDCFGDHEEIKNRPHLNKIFVKIYTSITDFYLALIAIAHYGNLDDHSFSIDASKSKLKRKHLKFLNEMGIQSENNGSKIIFTSTEYPGIWPGWKALSTPESMGKVESIFRFSHGLADDDYGFLVDVFASLAEGDSEKVYELDQHLKDNGFMVQYGNGMAVLDLGLGVKYYKSGELRFGMQYDVRRKSQLHYWMKLSRFRYIWDHYEQLSEPAGEFLFKITKQCDDCGFCRERDFHRMEPFEQMYKGQLFTLCPWYPRTSWRKLDSDIVMGIKELLDLQEKVLV